MPYNLNRGGGGADNSNKRCFWTKPKRFRESGDFSRNLDNWKFFRETRINSATLQKEIGTWKEIIFISCIPKIREDDPNLWDESRLKLRPSINIAQTAFFRVESPCNLSHRQPE